MSPGAPRRALLQAIAAVAAVLVREAGFTDVRVVVAEPDAVA